MTSTTFTFNNIVYTANEKNTYFYCWPEGRKGERTRIKKADFEAAYSQFVEAENARQNAANEFVNIDPLLKAAEDPTISVEEYCEMIEEANKPEYRAVVEGHEVTGSDLQVPAVLNEHGCVDCSKCNVQNCPHRYCFRRNPYNIGGIAECPRLKVKAEEPETEPETPKTEKRTKRTNKRPPKDSAFSGMFTVNGENFDISLTAKQVDFVKHLPDTCFWENGLDSEIWVDCLCDDIGGQFAGKPMTVGAMISTLCEKGLGFRAKQKVNGRKCTSFGLTDLGMKVFAGAEWGLE